MALCMTDKQRLGQRGEQLAADFLVQRGYIVIARNWHCPGGELDIVAKQGDLWVFIEVKTVRSSDIQRALAQVTPGKQQRLIRAVQLFLVQQQQDEAEWRLDVMAVALPYRGQPQIEQVENALDW